MTNFRNWHDLKKIGQILIFLPNKTNNLSTMVIYKVCNTLNISLSEFFNSSLFL